MCAEKPLEGCKQESEMVRFAFLNGYSFAFLEVF